MGLRDSLGIRRKPKSQQAATSIAHLSTPTPTSITGATSSHTTLSSSVASSTTTTSPVVGSSNVAVASTVVGTSSSPVDCSWAPTTSNVGPTTQNLGSVSAGGRQITVSRAGANPQHDNQALTKAIERHLAEIPSFERDAFRLAAQQMTETSVLNQVKSYDDAHRNKSSFRPRTETISRVFQSIQRFLNAIAIGIQANPDVSSIIVGCALAAITVATGFIGFFDKLTDMAARLSDYLEPLALYAKSSQTLAVVENFLVDVYVDTLSFFTSARRVFVDQRNNTRKYTSWRVFWTTQWIPFEENFTPIEARMQHHLKVLEHVVQATNLDHLVVLSYAEQERTKREKVKEKEEVLRWLSSHRFESTHAEIYAKKHPGTGDWLVQRPEFMKWLGNPGSTVLWCHGKPGAGKSVLASNVVEHIAQNHLLDDDFGVAFAYCSYRDTDTQDIAFVLTAFMQQLCQQKRDIPAAFLSAKQDGKAAFQLANVDTFGQLLEDLRFKTVILVIDALDECVKPQRVAFFKAIRELQTLAMQVKIFVTSRGDTDIYEAISQMQVPYISIDIESIQRDVECYVTEEVQRLLDGADGRKLNITSPSLQEKVISTLTAKAEGMFLWVNLQLLSLCEASESCNDRDVEDALDMLPAGLDATYERSLDHILASGAHRQRVALRIFRWVVYSVRALTVDEILDMLNFEDPKFVRTTSVTFLFSICANMLEMSGRYIAPIHYSVKEFLTRTHKLQISGVLLNNQESQIHGDIAMTCVGHLIAMLEGPEPYKEYQEMKHQLSKHPFLGYAALNFDEHVARSDKQSALIARTIDLLQSSDDLAAWLMHYRNDCLPSGFFLEIYKDPCSRKLDGISVIFSSRLWEMVEFDSCWKIGLPDTATFHLACYHGHGRVVSYFLDQGAEVGATNSYGQSAIYFATMGGHTDVVEKLLDHGADVNADAGKYGHILIQAAYEGNINTTKLLLDRKADVDVQSKAYGNALTAALRSGISTEMMALMVHLLLDKGVSINYRGGAHGHCLQVACVNAKVEIVQLLLNRGADVNTEGGYYGNCLQAACQYGDKDLVQLLLDAGANVNAEGGEYGSCLQAACTQARTDVVRLLLDRVANVNAKGGYYGNCLQAACANGSIELVKVLLDNGADINAKGGQYGNCLQAACARGSIEVVRLLLDEGADVNGNGGQYGNCLQAACARGSIEVVKLLLERRADVKARGGEYGTPLRAVVLGFGKHAKRILEWAGTPIGTLAETIDWDDYSNIYRRLEELKEIALGLSNEWVVDEIVQRQSIIRTLLAVGAVVDADRIEEA